MKQMRIATELVERMIKEKWIARAEKKQEALCKLFVQVGDDESIETYTIAIEMVNFRESTVLLIGGYGLYSTAVSCNTTYPKPHELCGCINSTVFQLSGYQDFIDIDYVDKPTDL